MDELNSNTQAGFIRIRRGIYEHLSDGRMTGREWMVYSVLHLKADHLTGICYKISGPALGYLLGLKSHYVNSILRTLEEKGYIKRLSHRGQVVCYPVVINKFLTSSGILIDAPNTKSLNKIAWYVKEDCILTVLQRNVKATSNVLQTSCLQEIKNITILKQEKTPKCAPKIFSEDSVEHRLAKLLSDTICKRKPDFKEPDLQKWAIHIDQMIRLDHRKPEQIWSVLVWCQQDDFWRNNILSTEKLRKQFDQLELKMQSQKGNFDGSGKNRGNNKKYDESYIR